MPLLRRPGGSKIRVKPFIGNQYPFHQAWEIAVIAHGIVHGRAIVPERQGARTPTETNLVFRTPVLVQDDGQQFQILRWVHAKYLGLLRVIHPQDLLAGLPMLAYDLVGDDRIIVTGSQQGVAIVMGDMQALEPMLYRVIVSPPVSGRFTGRSTAPQAGTRRQLVSV